MEDEFNVERGAKFNAGIAKLMRMGKLREGCHDYRAMEQYRKWYYCLKGIRSEINSKLTNEIKKKDKDKEDVKTERQTAKESEDKIKEALNDPDFEGDIEEMLYDYELWLGEMEEKYKFGMPDDESAGAALR